MNKKTDTYHAALAALERDGIARDYIHGWASGALGNPKLEEQRLSPGYEAGYADGRAGVTESAAEWKASPQK